MGNTQDVHYEVLTFKSFNIAIYFFGERLSSSYLVIPWSFYKVDLIVQVS